MSRHHIDKLVFALSATWMVFVFVSLVSLMFVPTWDTGHLKRGCYVTDALLPGVECRGFAEAPAVQFVLNVPHILLYSPFLVFSSLRLAVMASSVSGLMFAVMILTMWASIAYFYYYLWRKKLWLVLLGTIGLVPGVYIFSWFYRHAT